MKLSTIRDLLIVIGIYLYFIAWVYLHTYYSHFGISTESLRLDYSSYLVFSYNVLHSAAFFSFAVWCLLIFIVCWFIASFIFRKVNVTWKKRLVLCRPVLFVIVMCALFPILYSMAKSTALSNYVRDRTTIGGRHRIEFIFRSDAGFSAMDSSSYHLQLINNDRGRTLRLLGESDEYYIVLNQLPYDTVVKSFPEGSVYYINKKDVLVSRIVLSSR